MMQFAIAAGNNKNNKYRLKVQPNKLEK